MASTRDIPPSVELVTVTELPQFVYQDFFKKQVEDKGIPHMILIRN